MSPCGSTASRHPSEPRDGRERHKPAVAALAVLLATAVVALAVNSILIRAEKESNRAQRRLAVDNFGKADKERRRAELLSADLTMDSGLSLCEHGEVNRGLLWLAPRTRGHARPTDENLQRALRANLTGWGRQLTSLKSILRHPNNLVAAAAFSPDSRTIITVNCCDTATRR